MFEQETIVQILFRMLNFSILIGLFWYLIYKYGLPSIRAQIDERIRQQKAIEELERALEYQKTELKAQIQADTALSQSLQENIIRWTKHVQAHHQKNALKKEDVVQKLAQKSAIRAHYLIQLKAQKIIFPSAVAQAQQELATYFSQKEVGADCMSAIVSTLKGDGRP